VIKASGRGKRTSTILIIIAACACGLLIKLFIFDLMIIEGVSMEPTLHSGEIVGVFRAAYGIRIPFTNHYLVRWSRPGEGDLVIFASPSGEAAVKRVIWARKGEFYAEGDNRDESYDSRSYGPLSVGRIYGKVLR
jgi:signal peptidase I